ncbi:hypothetical protein [Anaerobiospirillum succiniciproducens]|uniref:hypothetical protein n=1 Tax=Anaerobiospirillum succiniciproducens TaxID=13335 RepID=UPI003F8CBF39
MASLSRVFRFLLPLGLPNFGFGAQSERLSIGAGLGYQGSSNVDEFTLTGNARYIQRFRDTS